MPSLIAYGKVNTIFNVTVYMLALNNGITCLYAEADQEYPYGNCHHHVQF